MKENKLYIIILLVSSLIIQSCKNSIPTGTQIAKPAKIGFLKGPLLVSAGKLYFLEDRAVYRPSNFYFNLQKDTVFEYAAIKNTEKARLFGILPLAVNLEMKDGKNYKIRVNKRDALITTIQQLKN